MRHTRTLLWLLGLLVLLVGFALLSQWGQGRVPIRPGDTAGWLAYVSDKEGKPHIWFVKPDGAHVRAEPDSSASDDEPTWQLPDGGTLFFTSDRTDRVSQIFHLSPVDASLNQLTIGGARKSDLQSSADGERILHIAGGQVSIHYLSEGSSEQVIPPPAMSEGEKKALMEYWQAEFGGSAFKSVTWGRAEDTIAGVIRGDRDEVLVVQEFDPRKREQERDPSVRLNAERIDLAYHPTQSTILVAFYGAHPPERDEDLRSWVAPAVPSSTQERTNGLFVFDIQDPSAGTMALFYSEEPDSAVLSPAWAPDGAKVAAVIAGLKEGELEPTALVIMPAVEAGAGRSTMVDEGRCGDPQWSPDGRKLAYTKGPRGGRQIWVYDLATGETKRITDGEGDNFHPRWSPKGSAEND